MGQKTFVDRDYSLVSETHFSVLRKPRTMGTYRIYGISIMAQDYKYLSLSVNGSNTRMV
jgi:hypothetical protein